MKIFYENLPKVGAITRDTCILDNVDMWQNGTMFSKTTICLYTTQFQMLLKTTWNFVQYLL